MVTHLHAPRRIPLDNVCRIRHTFERDHPFAGLRLVRDALGLTQTEVAEIAGVTQADISRIESGQVSPTVDRMSRILRRLNEWAEGS